MPAAPILPLDALATPRSSWDRFFEIVLGGLLLFMPFALGAVEAWSELVVVAGAALLSLALALRTALDRTFRPVFSWAYLPLGAFLALVVFQLLPLPWNWASALSPWAVQWRRELLGPDVTSDAATTLSMYPLATARGLRLVLAGAAIFLTVANVFATPPQIKRLLRWVLIVGCAQAVLALLQIFTFADKIHWTIETAGRVTSGSFFNYSNFCQFMNLSIGAGLALLLVDMHAVRGRSADRLQDHAGALAAVTVCAVSIFTSMSRNGAISLLVAAAVVGTALYRRGTLSRRGWILAMAPLATLAAILFFTFDLVYERLATLQHDEAYVDRWQLNQDVLRAWQDFPWWGAGLGTHEFVFPAYDTAGSATLAGHADNDYLQLIEETGLAGAAAVGLFLLVIAGVVVRLCRRGQTPIAAAAFGIAFGLMAAAIHSASDFGQHLPAAFSLSALLCGLAVSIARWERAAARQQTNPRFAPPLARQVGGLAALAVLIGVWWWAVGGAWNSFLAESWRGTALFMEAGLQRAAASGASPEELDAAWGDLLAASEEACRVEPANVQYGYWLNVYRWQAVSRGLGGVLHTNDPDFQPIVARIADALTEVRRLCPPYGPPYPLEGQLRLLALGEERGRELIRQGLRLAPYDPGATMTAAEIALNENNPREAVELLKRTVALQPAMFREAAALLIGIEQIAVVESLAAGDYSRLSQLADLSRKLQRDDLAQRFSNLAEESLRQRVAADQASPRELAALAGIEARQERHAEAQALYARALALDYKQIEWRLARARSLAAVGETAQAVHEAKICLRLRPGDPRAQQIIDQYGEAGR